MVNRPASVHRVGTSITSLTSTNNVAAEQLDLLAIWIIALLWMLWSLVLALNFKGTAESVFAFYARRGKVGSASVGTIRIVGWWGVGVCTLILLPDVLSIVL